MRPLFDVLWNSSLTKGGQLVDPDAPQGKPNALPSFKADIGWAFSLGILVLWLKTINPLNCLQQMSITTLTTMKI